MRRATQSALGVVGILHEVPGVRAGRRGAARGASGCAALTLSTLVDELVGMALSDVKGFHLTSDLEKSGCPVAGK